jgi:hypothetical protein
MVEGSGTAPGISEEITVNDGFAGEASATKGL